MHRPGAVRFFLGRLLRSLRLGRSSRLYDLDDGYLIAPESVSILQAPESGQYGGKRGIVVGITEPSSSGVAPIVGSDDDDIAVAVEFDDIDQPVWFAARLVIYPEGRPRALASRRARPGFLVYSFRSRMYR
jgi:hypothetical protein